MRCAQLWSALFVGGMVSTPSALAGGYSGDIELIRPSGATDAWGGFPGMITRRPGTTGWTLTMAYTANPLEMIEEGESMGPVVGRRTTTWLAGSVQATPALSFDAQGSALVQFGSQVPEYAADGFGIGDPFVGATVFDALTDDLAAGVRLELGVPLGRKESWIGESTARADLSGLVR